MSKNYKVLKQLGEGAFGKAFLCEKESDDSLCVIKQILIEGMNEQEIADALNESNILKKLNHPYIIKYYDVFKSKKPKHMINIVTEYADGGDLSEKIKERKNKNENFTEKEILDYLTQICLAIKHIHDKKIIHRDLKSENIFLMKNGKVKIGDFGISKIFKKKNDEAKTMLGTPFYLAPEILEGKPYDSSSDIWSLGVILYEIMTFQLPFNANSLPMLTVKIIRGNYIPPPSIYIKDLRELVSKCLTTDPIKRPTINEILRIPFVLNRIKSFLDEVQYNKEFAKNMKKEKRVIKPKMPKKVNIKVLQKMFRGTPMGNLIIKEEYNNNIKKQIKDYLKEENINEEIYKKENELNIFFQKEKKPAFRPVFRAFSQDQQNKIYLNNNNNDIEIFKEKNTILNEVFNNPYLMKKKDNSAVPNIFLDNTSIIKNDLKIQEKEIDDINDPIIFEKKFNELKNMGFNNDNLIREALLLLKGNIEEAKEYLSSAG